jgi:hypothetical protein
VPSSCSTANGYGRPNSGGNVEYAFGDGGTHRGVPDSIPPPVLEGPEVILGRRLGASSEIAPPPLPWVLSRSHQALRETEATILREWEALETELQRLGDWCTQLE